MPAYFRPTNNRWRDMCDALYEQLLEAVLVMNPSSGPGTSVDPVYPGALAQARSRRHRVIGYVTTRDDEDNVRPLAHVNAEVDRWYELYPGIGGIFFDEMSNNPMNKTRYRGFYEHVKGKSSGALVVGNPGTPAVRGGPLDDGAWQVTEPRVADVVVVFEGPWTLAVGAPAGSHEYRSWSAPAWVSARPAATFAHLVYASPDAATTKSICTTSSRRNAGWVYVTQDSRPNQWDTPPSAALLSSPTLRRRQVMSTG